MGGCLKWFFIIGIIALVIEYWYIAIPILIIFLFISRKAKSDDYTAQYNQAILPQNYDNMNGHEFEQYSADILRKNGFSNVYVTKGSGDFGIDILASKDGWKYAIQCKKYSSKVGNHAVQEAYSGKDYYNADIAVVMTNNFFTPAAIKTADRLDVELWDRNKLNNMVNQYPNPLDTNNIPLKTKPEISERAKKKLEEHRKKELAHQKFQNNIVITSSHTDTKTENIKPKEKELISMYDEEKGIYPSGEYLVGEDIPLGKYLLKQRDDSANGEIHIYKDYQSYFKNPDNELIFKVFKGDYHLSLRTEGNLLVVENADMQKL